MSMTSPYARSLRITSLVLAAGAVACGLANLRAPQMDALAQDAKPATPVLVELFTSEGCSDCPPADDLLARLDTEQFVPGVHAIVLSEHVTYWNHQGWNDPFALGLVDFRQKDYQERFGLASMYTPQMVVDGTEQFVGNSLKALDRAMAQAVAAPKQPLEISDAAFDEGSKGGIHFTARMQATDGVHLYAAVAQDVTRSDVKGGENNGRTLHHVAVMRQLKEFKLNFADGRALWVSASGVDKGKDAGAVRLVIFLVDAHTGHVVAAAEKPLARP